VVEDRRAAFCARLKAAREQKGVALEQIAGATKVARSLLKGLEENDLSRWPQGIYRRSYLRDYLRAIDLPEQSIVAEFVRLFPDGQAPCLELADVPESDEPCALSLTLADDAPERLARTRKHLLAAAFDLAAVLSLSALAWWLMHADVWASGAIIALGYYSAGTATLGRSPGSRLLESRGWRRSRPAPAIAASEPADTLLSRLREAKGLSGRQSEPAMTGGLFSVLVVSVVRTLFLR
jgi:transcriptional regulator with XRE-family HTH domain